MDDDHDDANAGIAANFEDDDDADRVFTGDEDIVDDDGDGRAYSELGDDLADYSELGFADDNARNQLEFVFVLRSYCIFAAAADDVDSELDEPAAADVNGRDSFADDLDVVDLVENALDIDISVSFADAVAEDDFFVADEDWIFAQRGVFLAIDGVVFVFGDDVHGGGSFVENDECAAA